MQNNDTIIRLFIILAVFTATLLVSAIVNISCWAADVKLYRAEAVKHGAAEWQVSQDGVASFHWITSKKID